MEKRALGKGLSALIPEREAQEAKPEKNKILYLKIGDIKPNRFQPREDFEKEAFEELAASIKEKGLVQPVLVRKIDGGYELIAGERRLRAAKYLNIEEIPAIVRESSDLDSFEISLIENVQREDLNPIEQAKAYKRLIEEFKLSQENVADAIGKDRATVANIIRLLKLPSKIQDFVSRGTITMGHARAILSLSNIQEQLMLCNKIVSKGLSVRETERFTQVFANKKPRKSRIFSDPNILSLEQELSQFLGSKVRIIKSNKKGRIEIEFYTEKDLERIVTLLKSNR